jgi:hypothetical protein
MTDQRTIGLAEAKRKARRKGHSVKGWRKDLVTNSDGAPLPLLANAIVALRDSDEFANVLALDESTCRASAPRSAAPPAREGKQG